MVETSQIADEISVLMPMIARRIFIGFFQATDLTQTQIFTIMTLFEKAPCQLNELGAKLQIAAPTITGIVDRLQRLDYVKRIPDTQDRRVVNVDLTVKGQKTAKSLKKLIKEKWEDLLKTLSKKDQEDYLSILRKIQRSIG